jgi:hypothetical protein
MSTEKTAAQLLRQLAAADPEGHRAALGRAYLSGPDRDPEFYPEAMMTKPAPLGSGPGWFPFGFHATMPHPPQLEFSDALDNDGMPRWERAKLGAGQMEIIVATQFGSLLPQIVTASSLPAALDAAKALPFTAWFPQEDDEQVEP